MDTPARVDLGHGHWLEPLYDLDDVLDGFFDHHPHAQRPDEMCEGVVLLDGSRAAQPASTWTMLAGDREHLTGITLTPSLLCRSCGEHGFVREGKWVPA